MLKTKIKPRADGTAYRKTVSYVLQKMPMPGEVVGRYIRYTIEARRVTIDRSWWEWIRGIKPQELWVMVEEFIPTNPSCQEAWIPYDS